MLSDFVVPEMPWLKISAAVALAAGLVYGGYHWRDNSAKAEIAKITADRANEHAAASNAALEKMTGAAKAINDAATQSAETADALKHEFAKLDKERKAYVKSHPLPVDCKPDVGRMRSLEQAINAANSALSAP